MTKRPMVIITVCYIISIIWGIYLKKYIPFLVFILILIDFILVYKALKNIHKRFFIFCVLCTILLCISSIFISQKDNSFYNFQVKDDVISAIMVIEEVNQDSEYYYNYVAKVIQYKDDSYNQNVKLNLKIPKKTVKKEPKYGDLIYVNGEFEKGEVRRNYKGFSYFDYLKQKNIYGIVKSEKVEILKENYTNGYNMWINSLRDRFRNNIRKLLPKENVGIAFALLIGDSTEIEDSQKQTFSNANLSHILAISGMHVSYVILRY